MKRSLLVRKPDGSTSVFPLDKPIVKLGRTPENDLVLADAERSVSRAHAAIHSDAEGSVSVADLNSSNGTLVNGRRIGQPTPLSMGDTIGIGQFLLTVQEDVEDIGFNIQAGAVELDDLQKKPALLPLSGHETASPGDLKNLELLYEVGVTLARSQSIDEVTKAAIELLFKIDEVHRATVMLWDQERKAFGSYGLHLRNAGTAGSLPKSYDPANVVMSRTILNQVRQQNRPLLIRDAKADAMLDSAASIIRAGIQAAFCSPLSFQGQFLGILYADNLAEPNAFSEADFRTFTSIAAQTGLALANAISSQQLRHREVEREALRMYLPPQVADLVMATGGMSQLKGVLQPVTVMYVDIRGFTTMSEKMEAREVVHMLNDFFTSMSAIIFRCNGTLDKFIGDCIMSLFGAPVPSDQAPHDALNTAILMQCEMERLNQERIKRNAPPFQIGIGLHCGSAVVGNIGSADRVQYTAIGDTVNVAARLCSKAAAGQVIVSEDVKAALPNYAGFEPLGDVELKGRASKMHIFSTRWRDCPLP